MSVEKVINTTIYSIPNDIMGYTFSFTLNLYKYRYHLNDSRMVWKYNTINAIVRTCKWWHEVASKLIDVTELSCFPFRDSCCNHNIVAIRHLLENPKVDIHVLNSTVVEGVIGSDNVETFKTLKEHVRFDENRLGIDRILELCGSTGAVEILQYLINVSGVDPSTNCNICLLAACVENQVEIVQLLIEDGRVLNPKDTIMSFSQEKDYKRKRIYETSEDVLNKSLRTCIRFDNVRIFTELMATGKFKPTIRELRKACENDNVYFIEILLPLVDNPNAGPIPPLVAAIKSRSRGSVEVLLRDPRIDVCVLDNRPIVTAIDEDCEYIVKMLIGTGKIDPIPYIQYAIENSGPDGVEIFEALYSNYEDEFREEMRENRVLYELACDHGRNIPDRFLDRSIVKKTIKRRKKK